MVAAILRPVFSRASTFLRGQQIPAGSYQAAMQPDIYSNLDQALMKHANTHSSFNDAANIAVLIVPGGAEVDFAKAGFRLALEAAPERLALTAGRRGER